MGFSSYSASYKRESAIQEQTGTVEVLLHTRVASVHPISPSEQVGAQVRFESVSTVKYRLSEAATAVAEQSTGYEQSIGAS